MTDTYRIDIRHVAIEQRYVERDGWLQHQSRRLEVSRDCAILTPWEDMGARIRLGGDPEPRPWWKFWA